MGVVPARITHLKIPGMAAGAGFSEVLGAIGAGLAAKGDVSLVANGVVDSDVTDG